VHNLSHDARVFGEGGGKQAYSRGKPWVRDSDHGAGHHNGKGICFACAEFPLNSLGYQIRGTVGNNITASLQYPFEFQKKDSGDNKYRAPGGYDCDLMSKNEQGEFSHCRIFPFHAPIAGWSWLFFLLSPQRICHSLPAREFGGQTFGVLSLPLGKGKVVQCFQH
jgi:hypothetical protein